MRPVAVARSRRAFLLGLGLSAPMLLGSRRPVAGQTSVRSSTLGALRRTVALQAVLDHPQGITASADGATWFVSSVLRAEKKGVLAAFRAADGALLRRVEIQDGPRYHPGGLGRHGDTLWVPVAEYAPSSSSVIQARDVASLAVRSGFAVADHIGAVAATSNALVGCNWDARVFYEWTVEGVQSLRIDHDGAARYQDLHWAGESLLAAGLLGDTGVVDLLAWPSLDLQERIIVGRSDRGVVLSHEGMAVAGQDLLLLPEDDPSRVFVYAWSGGPPRR